MMIQAYSKIYEELVKELMNWLSCVSGESHMQSRENASKLMIYTVSSIILEENKVS